MTEIIECLAYKCVTCSIIVFILLYTFLLEFVNYSLPPGSPGAPVVRFCTPESPGVKVVNGDGFPTQHYESTPKGTPPNFDRNRGGYGKSGFRCKTAG